MDFETKMALWDRLHASGVNSFDSYFIFDPSSHREGVEEYLTRNEFNFNVNVHGVDIDDHQFWENKTAKQAKQLIMDHETTHFIWITESAIPFGIKMSGSIWIGVYDDPRVAIEETGIHKTLITSRSSVLDKWELQLVKKYALVLDAEKFRLDFVVTKEKCGRLKDNVVFTDWVLNDETSPIT